MKFRVTVIILTLILFFLGGYIVISKHEIGNKDQNITIPAIVVPKRTMEFKIEKIDDSVLSFAGVFSKEECIKNISNLLANKKILYDIRVDPKLVDNKEIILLMDQILPIIRDRYTTWLIFYKNRKLLIDGETTSKVSNEKINNLLTYSKVNSFNNTKIKAITVQDKDSEVVDYLEKIISTREIDKNQDFTDGEVETILFNLEEVVDIEKERSSQKNIMVKKKEKIKKKRRAEKKKKKNIIHWQKKSTQVSHLKDREKEKKNETFVSKNLDTPSVSEVEHYQKLLKKNMPDEDILALPMVQTVDMDIEEKIDKGLLPPLRTEKPLVKKEPIIIPSKADKIDTTIPWAKLHDENEVLEGIVSDEIIASPEFKKE